MLNVKPYKSNPKEKTKNKRRSERQAESNNDESETTERKLSYLSQVNLGSRTVAVH